jgi:hypothetical protein
LILFGTTLSDEKVVGQTLDNLDKKLSILSKYFGSDVNPKDFDAFMRAIGNISLLPSVRRCNPVPSASLRQMFTERVFTIPRAKTTWPSLQPLGCIAADSFSEAISPLSSPFGLISRMDVPCSVSRLLSRALSLPSWYHSRPELKLHKSSDYFDNQAILVALPGNCLRSETVPVVTSTETICVV